MEPLLIVGLSGVVLTMFINLSFKCLRKSKNLELAGKKIYTIRKTIPYFQGINAVLFIIIVLTAYSYADLNLFSNAVNQDKTSLFNHEDIFMKWVFVFYIITVIIMFINFTLSLMLQNELCENGIITLKGRYTDWSSITGIEERDGILRFKKEIDLYINGRYFDTIKLNTKDYNKVIAIIKSKVNFIDEEYSLTQ